MVCGELVRRFVGSIVVVGMGLVVAGCGAAESDVDVPPGFLTPEQATVEYREEAVKWDLPSGWSWPDDPGYGEVGAEHGGAFFEEKSGQVDASWYWYCAWVWTLVDAESESDRRAHLEQVLMVRDTPYYQVGLESTEHIERNLSAAEAGDFQLLTDYVRVNCPR